MRVFSRQAFISILFVAFLSVWAAGCGPEDKPETAPAADSAAEEQAAAFEIAAEQQAVIPKDMPLEILRFGPEGQVRQLSQVAVIFNQPMVALGAYEEPPAEALSVFLEPLRADGPPSELAGRTAWLNQYTLAFVPDKPLSGSAQVKAVLRPELLPALSGAVLPPQKRELLISLPPLAVDWAQESGAPIYEAAQALQPGWRVCFNQAPDLKSLAERAYFSWGEESKRQKVASKVEPADGRPLASEAPLCFDFQAAQPLPRDTAYRLELDSGVRSLAGPEPAEAMILGRGHSYGPLKLALAEPDNSQNMDPAEAVTLIFSNPVRLSEIAPLISLDNDYDLKALRQRYAPEKQTETLAEGEENLDDFSKYLELPGPLKAERDYTLTLAGTARDIFGQSLGQEARLSFRTGQYEAQVKMDGQFGLLETAGDCRIPVQVTNLPELKIEGYAFGPQEAAAFLAAAEFHPGSYNGWAVSLASDFLQTRRPEASLLLPVPGGAKDGPQTLAVDLKQMFGKKIHGHLLLLKSTWYSHNGDNIPRDTFSLLQVSDLGLALKAGASSSLAWVTDLVRGQAQPGAELLLLNAEGEVIFKGLSDNQGLVRLPGSRVLLEAAGEKGELFAAAVSQGQMSLWNMAWNEGLENWRWDLPSANPLTKQAAREENWLLSALPLYKPGERAKLKIIARTVQDDGRLSAPSGALSLEILDGRGQLIQKDSVELNELGTAVYELDLPAEAAAGYWMVRAGRPEQGQSMDYLGSFMVMSYRAPAFEIELDGLPTEAVSGERVSFKARGLYHFGAPVAGQPVSYALAAQPQWWSLPGPFSSYSVTNSFTVADDYGDSGLGPQEPALTVLSEDSRLNNDGVVDISLVLEPRPERRIGPQLYSGSITVTDVDERRVSTEASFLVHPAELYAGLWAENYLAEPGRPFKLRVIAADRQGRLVPGREIKTTVYKRQWRNLRRKNSGDSYEYISRMVDEPVDSRRLVSDEKPVELELSPREPGFYWVLAELSDEKGRLNQASLSFYAAGGGPAGWRLDNDDSLTLVADRREYKPGQEARIMVQSPFESGEGLVTVEREGVLRSETFKIENNSPVINIPIEEEDAPNIFVSVLLVRGRLADQPESQALDLGRPAMRLGYIELKVPSARDRLTVELEPSSGQVGPGEEIELSLAVRDHQGRPQPKAELAVIAADAAVIQLAGEEGYFPDSLYQADRPLKVWSSDNLISLIGRRHWGLKGGRPGGGGAEMAMLASRDNGLEDSVRSDFASLAFFEPQLAVDEQGQARLKIKLPENLGKFKLYAVATGEGRLSGTGQSEVTVTKDFLLRSALPGYGGVGDELEAAAVLVNRGSARGLAEVELSGDNFTLLSDSPRQKLEIGPGENLPVSFKVRLGSGDKALFRFSARLGENSDSVEYVLPVSPPNELTVQAAYLPVEAGESDLPLALAEGVDPQRGGLELKLSPTLAGALAEAFKWLEAYPHGCVEQNISKGFGRLYWLALRQRLNGSEAEASEARRGVEELLTRLSQWELDGGYNLWPEQRQWQRRSVYLTAYALDFHLAAQASGFQLPNPAIMESMRSFLLQALGSDSEIWPQWYSAQAKDEARSYALAALSRAGEQVAAYTERLYERRADLSLFELINLIRALGAQRNYDGADGRIAELWALIDQYLHFSAGELSVSEPRGFRPEIWSSAVRSTAMLLSALLETEPASPLVPALTRWLMSAGREGHFGSTQDNAVALGALTAYIQRLEAQAPSLSLEASVGESQFLTASFNSFGEPPALGRLSWAELEAQAAPSVRLRAQGQGRVWAAARLASAPAEPDLKAGGSGYMLSRSFTLIEPDGRERPGRSSFQRGDLVRVTVTMLAPGPRHATVLTDRVPAGLEPINFQLADADQSLLPLLVEPDEAEPFSRLWYNHQQIWPDRVSVYADYLPAGLYTFTYLARAVTPGRYLTPGPRAEEMYAPETYGRGAGQELSVR